MKAVVQRVKYASVTVDHLVVGKIDQGLLILLGVQEGDVQDDLEWLAGKISKMRIFSDAEGKMNLAVQEVQGRVLVVSQFTLHALVKKGNRPSFIKAARPEKAIPLYEYFIKKCESELGKKCKSGIFGADMKVELVNDGPVTVFVDSKERE